VYGRLAARLANVPVVITAEMAVDLWKGKTHLALDGLLARWTDRVVGNSQAVVAFYERAGVPPERLACIPSGIADEEPPDIDRSAVRLSLGLEADCPVAVFVGRLAPQKGVKDLILALDVLQHVRPRLRTLIIGDGPSRPSLEELAGAFHLDGRVRFLGHREDVPQILAAADVLVLPSLYEGLPNVVLEAMRFRKPVVATSAPGTTEVVVHGETGLLVPIHAPTELARAIRSLIDDPTFAGRLGEGGRAHAETNFRADTMVERFVVLYQQLAREKSLAV
jgi:glycosyltransferase involved in cell wall biosynthesis